MVQALAFCTSNKHKAAEVGRILGSAVEPVSVDLVEIQSLDPSEVSRHKALQAYGILGRPVIVDDTALSLDGLGGFPGALVAHVLNAGGPGLLHRMLPSGTSASAIATTTIAYAASDGCRVFRGDVPGFIVAEPRGGAGFGFDPVFVPEGAGITYAEMSAAEKDAVSPRRVALDQLAVFLENCDFG